MTDVIWINLAFVVGLMTIVWLISLPLRDVSIIDIVWGLGFVVVVWNTLFRVDTWTPWRIALAVLATVWGLRLSGYLLWRNWGEGEDRRYQSMRRRFGPSFWLTSLFIVFLLQASLVWVVSLPLQSALLAGGNGSVVIWVAVPGVMLWSVGLLFETAGDLQLAKFKSDPANDGKVLDRGLWRYTRHPNYFGDFLVWWGMAAIAFALGAAWWTVIGPVVMSILLMKVSGVTLLESSLKERKPEYQAYIGRTNAFFPGPPHPSQLGHSD